MTTICLLGFSLVAAVTDWRTQHIYNWTTYPGILLALIARGSDGYWALGLEGMQSGISDAVAGLFACGGLMLVCFLLFDVGGGDLKLVAMQGAYLGLYKGFEAMLWTFVFGACWAIIVLMWRVGALRFLGQVARQLFYSMRLGGWLPLSQQERALLKPPLNLGPAAFVAVLVVRFQVMEFLGWL